MKRIYTILLLINFVTFTIGIGYFQNRSRSYITSIPAEEEHGTSKGIDVNEKSLKLLHQFKYLKLAAAYFYLCERNKFNHVILHIFPVDWLETLSPPPELA